MPVPWQEHFILIVLGFWIFAKLHSRPEKQVFEHRWAFCHQFWRNSTDGCPLWSAIARPPEVQLTWVLFLWLANAQLMIWGFWIFAKLHSRPEICAFENGLTKSVTFASILGLNSRLPSLTGHSSARRVAIYPGPFSTARGFPADDFGLLNFWKTPL